DVKGGFVVNALKDIKISGNVNHSNIISREGNIHIDGIVLDEDITDDGLWRYLENGSDNQHIISAHQKVIANGLQNARVFAGDSVEVHGSIVRSHVYSSSTVKCKESIYASKISTACGVEANYFGNSSGVATIIEFLN